VVECDLAKVEVASSNLVSRSKNSSPKAKGESLREGFSFRPSPFDFLLLFQGGVAKW
jgi:hypothetical protein